MKTSFHHRQKNIIILIALVTLISILYPILNRMGTDSSIASHANLDVSPPFLYRLLLPIILSHVLPASWLDSFSLRSVMTGLSLAASLLLIRRFLERLLQGEPSKRDLMAARLGFIGVVIAHYLLPRDLKFYYVYDLPAIAFYLAVFLLLTAKSQRTQLLTIPTIAIASLNRETVMIAVAHAAVFNAVVAQKKYQRWLNQRFAWDLAIAAICFIVTLLMKGLVVRWLDQNAVSTYSATVDGKWRLIYNIQSITTEPRAAMAMLWFGCGAAVWIPLWWKHFAHEFRIILLASTPFMLIFSIVGNLAELRMFSEFTPVLGVTLGIVVSHRLKIR